MFSSVRYRGSSSYSGNGEEEDKQVLLSKCIGEEDPKYDNPSVNRIPWKGIILAIVLNLIGSFMLLVYICSLCGLISFQPADSLSYLVLALITFIPGCYHCVIVWRAFRGDEGYSLDDIADLN